MFKFICKRIGLGIIVLLGVVTITFFITRVIPSEPAAQWAGPRATPEQIEQAKIELGLDKPYIVQYVDYIRNLLHGDLGMSLKTKLSVTKEIMTYLPPTIEIVVLALALALLAGTPLGVLAASKKDSFIDHIDRIFSVGAVSFPIFWIGLLFQLVFFSLLHWLPLGGQVDLSVALMNPIQNITGFKTIDALITGNIEGFFDVIKHMILPALTISLYPMGLVSKMVRSTMIEILQEDYIVASRSYGIKKTMVLWKYAFKNSLGTTVTVFALAAGYALVNTFLVETIFSWPGIGNYISTAVISLDYPAIMGVTLFSSVVYIVVNLIADIIIALDPRVRI